MRTLINAVYSYCLNNVVSFALLVFIITLFAYKRLSNSDKKLPPCIPYIPLFGSIPFLGTDKVEESFSEYAKKYGPVFYVQLGSYWTVVLNSYETIHEAFVKQGPKFNGRYHTYFTLLSCNEDGIFFIDDLDKWKVQRSFGIKSLSGKGLHGRSIESRISEEADLLCENVRKKQGKPFIIETDLIHSVANIINGITMQERCDEVGNEKLLSYVHLVIEGFRKDGWAYLLLAALPWFKYFPFVQSVIKEMKAGIKLGNDVMDSFIHKHEATLDSNSPRDFIDDFLIESKNDTPSFSKVQLRQYLKDLFSAGTETSTSTIRWMLMYLIKFPDIQEKIHQEIDTVLGRHQTPRLTTQLPYVSAVIQETYRIKTMVPLGLPRRTTEDVDIMGYHIPKNTQVIANLWQVHNDPRFWPDPDRFDPGRHLGEDGNFIKSSKVIPFSIGPRNCLGEHLARNEIFLLFVTLMQKFQVCGNPEQPEPTLNTVLSVVCSPEPYPLIMKER